MIDSPEAGNTLSARILTTHEEIRNLEEAVRRLAPAADHTLFPRFFLASMGNGWQPRVIVVQLERQTLGIVYGKERLLAGIPLGVVYADSALSSMTIADPAHREAVFSCAIRALFARRRMRALRLSVPTNGFEMRAASGIAEAICLECRTAPVESHARVLLASSYEDFLNRLGHRTRKNFRYYTRRSEAAGHIFVEQLSIADLRDAARQLKSKCSIPMTAAGLERALNWIAGVESPMVVGIRDGDGRWLSFAGGWYTPGCAVLSVQLNNDTELEDYSLSQVLRAKLIEMLIRRGVGELWFWAGVTPPLSRYAEFLPVTALYLDSTGLGWRMARRLAGWIGPRLPRPVARDVAWIAAPPVRS